MKNTMRISIGLAALFIAALPYTSSAAPKAADPPAEMTQSATAKAVDLRLALRTLWEGHIFWVRNVVISTHFGDTKAAKAAEDQVVQNAKAIGEAVASFNGKEAGDKLFNLLAGHYGAVKDYMNASFKSNKKGEDAATEKASKNADEIAAFLSSANPNLPKETLVSLLVTHYGHHVTQINGVKAKDWAGEAQNWSAMVMQIDTIADALSAALVKQFPKKF